MSSSSDSGDDVAAAAALGRERIEAIFKSLDNGGKGYLLASDLGRMMPQATDEQLNLILNALDTSGHGRVTSEDFFKNFSALAASFKEEQAVQDSSSSDAGPNAGPSDANRGARDSVQSSVSDVVSARGSARKSTLFDSTPRESEQPASMQEYLQRRGSVSSVTEDSLEDVDPAIRESAEGERRVVSAVTGGAPEETHRVVGELMQRNRILESRVRQFARDHKKEFELKSRLEDQEMEASAKDRQIQELRQIAESLQDQLKAASYEARRKEVENQKLATTLSNKSEEQKRVEAMLADTETRLQRVLISSRKNKSRKSSSSLSAAASLIIRDDGSPKADGSSPVPAAAARGDSADVQSKVSKKSSAGTSQKRPSDTETVERKTQRILPKKSTASMTPGGSASAGAATRAVASAPKPEPKPEPKPIFEGRLDVSAVKSNDRIGKSVETPPPKSQELMVRDALTGKMVPVTSLIGQIESALVRGGGARPKIPDKGIPRDGHKDAKTALWASYDSNVNVLPATKLQFDCEFSEVPGKVVVRAEGAQFRVTFRNTSIVGVRMDGRGGFFHVYFDGTLSKGFATRSGPADYELYNGIQGQHSVKIVKSSAGGTSKDRTFEVFGLILSNDGRVVERLGDHRPKTPPPRSRRGAAADKLKTRGATSKSFSHGPAGATVVVEMDKSNLGIHHSALTITRLASKGQALQRGVRVGWKVTHVEGNPVFDSKSFKAELIRARQKRARFTMSFQVPAGNEYRVKAPQPPQKKPDTKQQTKSVVGSVMSWLGMGAVATPAHSRTLSAAAERPDSFPDGPTGGDTCHPALSSLRNAQQLRVKTGSLGAASSPTADSFLKNLTKAPRVLPITSQPPTPTNKSESASGKSNAVLHSPTLHPFSPTMLDNYSGFRQKTPKSGASRQQSPTSASRGGARGGWDFSGISSSGVHREKMLKPVELSSDTDAAAAAGAANRQKPVKAMSARASAASRGGAVTTAAAKGSKTAKASSGKKKGGFFSFSIPKLQLWRIGGGEQDSKAKDTTPQDAKSAATSRPETQTKKKRSKKRKKKARSNATPQSARPSRDSDGKPAALYIPAGSMTSRIERRDQSKGTSVNITDSSSSDENASDLGPMYPTGEAMRARNFKRQTHIKERAKRLADMAESIRPQTARPAIAAPNTPFERFQRDRERAEKLKEKKQKRENRSKSGNPSSPALRPQTSRSRRDAKSVPRDFDGGIDEYKREARRMRRLRLRSRGSPEIERPQTGLRNASPEAETGVLRSARGRRGRGASSGGIRNVEEEVLDGPITLKTLWSAARHGRHKKMAQLIRAGLNPNTPDEHGNTALILACQNGQQKTAKLAIEAGADVNHRNAKGQTALFYSKKYGYNSVELYLKQFKATE